MTELLVLNLGLRSYAEALAFQRSAAAARITGEVPSDLLILVEHNPVVTLGRGTKSGNLLLSPDQLALRGVELFEVERGGDITFHGPGQIVGYPIVDLTGHKQDLHWYLRQIEEVMIQSVSHFGISAERNPGKTGVWTRGRKLASIGVHARQWVTWHGFALNVTTELGYFDMMVPCGIPDVVMTSVEREQLEMADATCLAASPTLFDDVRDTTVRTFAEVFGLSPREVSEAELKIAAEVAEE